MFKKTIKTDYGVEKEVTTPGGWIAYATVALTLLVAFLFTTSASYRVYSVWSADKLGESELARANQNRQIKVQEAKAHLDSAKFYSDAEVERARGVAEANRIIADGLGGPEGYLRYLYIDSVAKSDSNQIIYLPTEAGVPILEAGKRP